MLGTRARALGRKNASIAIASTLSVLITMLMPINVSSATASEADRASGISVEPASSRLGAENALNDPIYQYPDYPAAVNGVNVGQPGQNFRDTFFDCNAISETATYYVPPPNSVTEMRVDLINFSNCSVITTPNVVPSLSANFERRILSIDGEAVITNTTSGKTLTVIYGDAPAATSALSSASARGIVGVAITPINLTTINITPTDYSVDPALPDGLSIDPTTGEISGTPTVPSQGQYAITASDGSKTATGIFTLIVSAAQAYDVTFEQNLGTNPITRTVSPGQSLVLPPTNSVPQDEVLGGWFTAPDGGGDYAGMAGDPYTPMSSVALFAHWVPVVEITLDLNSPGAPSPQFPDGSTSPVSIEAGYGETVSLPVPTRPDTAFRGWYSSTNDCTASSFTSGELASKRIGVGGDSVAAPSTANVTWYACWQESQVITTFSAGFSASFPDASQCTQILNGRDCRIFWTPGSALAPNGRPQITAPLPTKSGYRFDGWYTTTSDPGVRIASAGDDISVDYTEPVSPGSKGTYRARWTKGASITPDYQSKTFTVGVEMQTDPLQAEFPISNYAGPVVYEIDKELPAGLAFDTQTGVISGTPETTLSYTNYYVKTSDGVYEDEARIQIRILNPPGAYLSRSLLILEEGEVINPVNISAVFEAATTWTALVDPPLPDGLLLSVFYDNWPDVGWDFFPGCQFPNGWNAHYDWGVCGTPGAEDPNSPATSVHTITVISDEDPSEQYTTTLTVSRGAPTTPPAPSRPVDQVKPGDTVALEEGKPVVAPVIVNDDSTGKTVQGNGFELSLQGVDAAGAPVKLAADGVLVLSADRRVAAAGKGFLPNAPVAFHLFPSDQPVAPTVHARLLMQAATDEVLVGTLTTDDTGDFTGTLVLPEGMSPGDYMLQAVGYTDNGDTRSITLGVRVDASSVTEPTPATPAGPPLNLSVTPSQGSAVLTWSPPERTGDFPITQYQVVGSPSGTCLVAAPAQTCIITGLTSGVEYTFRVRALTGAGWGSYSEPTSAVIPEVGDSASILVTGTRADVRGRPGVQVTGVTTGLEGALVTPRVRLAKEEVYSDGVGLRTVGQDGRFTWQRVANRWVYVYFLADGVRSNRLVFR